LVDINKKLENLPILGLAIFGINATGSRSPAVDRDPAAIFSFSFENLIAAVYPRLLTETLSSFWYLEIPLIYNLSYSFRICTFS
jgi:hypothetical protein